MHTELRPSRRLSLLPSVLASTLLLMPLLSRAQTLFGTGGSTNTAPFANNLAFGYRALANSTGSQNTANGYNSLFYNTTGGYNSAFGAYALVSNTTGNNNIAVGFGAGQYLTVGHNNIIIGSPGVTGDPQLSVWDRRDCKRLPSSPGSVA